MTASPPRPPLVVQPVVLAGGRSAQLWPLSRAAYPKQLLQLHGKRTLLQDTLARVAGLSGRPVQDTGDGEKALSIRSGLVVCNEAHRYLIAEQIKEARSDVGSLLLEPVSRGTAPALTIAALAARSHDDGGPVGESDPILLVMPADHVVGDLAAWHDAVARGAALAEQGKIVAFGVIPTRPETDYGYIRKGAQMGSHAEGFALAAFVEKPAADAARSYISAGKYLWNSGLYMVRASVWLDTIALADGQVAESCGQAHAEGEEDGSFFRVASAPFTRAPEISIDRGVMERLVGTPGAGSWRTRGGDPITAAVVLLEAGWSDVGSWPSLLEFSRDDADGNVLRGDVWTVDTHDSVLISTRRLLSAVGVRDLVAVETADAVLIVSRDRCQEIPGLVDQLRAGQREEVDFHSRVYRPWGDYESLDAGDRYQVKRLSVKPGEVLSLQMHHHRAEHWVVVRGTARVTRGDEVFLLTENESTYIPVGMKHRLENPGTVPLEIIEVQSGSYLGEDDIVRFEDRYNRTSDS